MFTTVRHAWSRVRTIARPFFRYEARWRATWLFALLVGLLLSVSGLNVLNSYVNNFFMTALEQGDGARFWGLALLYAGVFLFVALVAAVARYVEERLGLLLREGLTRHLIGRYLADRT